MAGPAIGIYARAITPDPAGRFVYVTTTDQGVESVRPFQIDLSTGGLTVAQTAAIPRALVTTIDPSGRFAYVTTDGLFVDGGSGNLRWVARDVRAYAIDSTTGTLTLTASSLVPGIVYDLASAVAVHPSGRFGVLANEGVYNFTGVAWDYNMGAATGLIIDQTTGALTKAMPTPITLRGPDRVVIDPSGRFAYAAGQKFTIDQTTGVLTAAGAEPVTPHAILAVIQ
jgi:DNA-binding beta-propeller fold protein YncE